MLLIPQENAEYFDVEDHSGSDDNRENATNHKTSVLW